MTSLYPTTHGVHGIPDRLPSTGTTVAEVYRQAGYATASFSSVSFTGQFTNLHQGFEEVHESESAAGRAGPRGSKTAREFVDRLTEWLEDHRDVPSFVYLHFFDPHSPYEPNRPYDTMWADPKGREDYNRHLEELKKHVKDAFMAERGMATPDELKAAGIDAAGLPALREGLVRRVDPRHGRRDRSPGREDRGAGSARPRAPRFLCGPRRGIPRARRHVARPNRVRGDDARAPRVLESRAAARRASRSRSPSSSST